MDLWRATKKDPFRVFFNLGVIAGLLGVGVWLPLAFGVVSSYPMVEHRMLMIGGFLLSFVCGFLTTAIPRFTKTDTLSGPELSALVITQLAVILSASLQKPIFFFSFVLLTLVNLLIFASRRFRNRQENPPFTFIFIGMGLLLWVFSDVVLLVRHIRPLLFTVPLIEASSNLFFHGALMFMVVGIGGRLIPGILGWKEIVAHQRAVYERPLPYLKVIPKSVMIMALLLLLSFFLETFWSETAGLALRGLVLIYVAVKFWQIHRRPKIQSKLTWGIWLAGWCLALGPFLNLFWQSGGVHALHVILIGGFSLLTLMVASQVTLAHGSEASQHLRKSWLLALCVALILVAMVIRVTAWLMPARYLPHLGYAAVIWLIALLLWSSLFIPRLLLAKRGDVR